MTALRRRGGPSEAQRTTVRSWGQRSRAGVAEGDLVYDDVHRARSAAVQMGVAACSREQRPPVVRDVDEMQEHERAELAPVCAPQVNWVDAARRAHTDERPRVDDR